MQRFTRALVLGLTGTLVTGSGAPRTASSWLQSESNIAVTKLFDNISPAGAKQGVVIASPQLTNPDYFYYWIRDGALTMQVVLNLYKQSSDATSKAKYKQALEDYMNLSQANQNAPAIAGLGEPKFNADGSDYTGSWARPQNDGPALRAITLIDYANQLLAENNQTEVQSRLYAGEFPATTIIKRDLEYVAHNWMNASYDPWEEIEGTNFYTLRVQRKAMIVGADLANKMNDGGAAVYYQQQATQIEQAIEEQLEDYGNGLLVPTANRVAGIDYKTSNMDASTILGVLHGQTANDPLPVSSELVLSTIYKLTQTFQKLYPIDQRADLPGVAIGRYPEDRYAGADFTGGNPWVLLTFAFAETLYKASAEIAQNGSMTVTPLTVDFYNGILARASLPTRVGAAETITASSNSTAFNDIVHALANEADSYVTKVMYHANPDGSLSEQIDRNSGFMTSAANLTWNYASVLTAETAQQSAQSRRALSVSNH